MLGKGRCGRTPQSDHTDDALGFPAAQLFVDCGLQGLFKSHWHILINSHFTPILAGRMGVKERFLFVFNSLDNIDLHGF